MRQAGHGRVQLHRLPRESACEGRGCGDRKRPASYQQAEERMRCTEGGGRQRSEGGGGKVAMEKSKGSHAASVGGNGGGRRGGDLRGQGEAGSRREAAGGGRGACRGLSERGTHRYGEAENPGPEEASAGGEGRGAESGGAGAREVGMVEAAWEAVQSDPGWVPAWKTWSREVVTGSVGGRLTFELRSPHQIGEEEGDGDGHAWAEEELEAFLQECEVEAGWRDSVDASQADRLRQEWRDWEAEMATAGIQGPCLEESGKEAAAGTRCSLLQGGAAEVTEEEKRAEGCESIRVPAEGEVGAVRKPEATEATRNKRRRWRPLEAMRHEGEPTLEHEDEAEREGASNADPRGQEAEVLAVPAAHEPRRTATVRPRGRRQRGSQPRDFAVDVVTFNGSGAPQALGAMAALSARRRSLGALLIQEHHGRGDALADLQAGARAKGMKLAPCEATTGKGGGVSAGVGVATPTHRGWGCIFGTNWDLSPPGAPGRLAGAWLQVGPRGGMLALSIWCWPAEGMSQRNVQLVGRALEIVTTSGCPWIIGGDWNATPSELVAAASGLLDRAGAVIRAPTCPTCYPAVGKARTLDYFAVDARMAGAVSEAVLVEEVVGSPHRAVKVSITGREVGGLVQMIRRPKMFPRERPIGCPRKPLVPQENGGGEEGGREEGDTLEEEWRKLAFCVEAELCRECDLVGEEGAPNRGYMGRGEGMRLVRRPLMAPRCMARHGRANGMLHRFMWILNRLEELIHLAGRRRSGWGEDSRCKQWERVVFALCKTDGCTRKLVELDAAWTPLLDFLETLRGRPREGAQELMQWARKVRESVDEQKGRVVLERRRTWREWVAGQIRRGGGALHAFTKRTLEQPEPPAMVEGRREGSPQVHADADRVEWDKTWQRLAGLVGAPWRGEDGGEEDEHEVMTIPTPKEMRRCARRFNPFTGIGADLFRPHWFGWISDPLLGRIAALMMRIEAVGRWPGQVMAVLVHLIPKEGGGRRPIGLLASVVRWWERMRAPVIRGWRMRHARPFNWAAPGRSAEKAVWEVALRDEAAMARGLSSAATLVDLVKAFEHIPLETLWAKGKKHRFPRKVLRLVLELCSAGRRLIFRGAVSEETSTLSAVVAGLVAAIDCMHLMVVDALDQLRCDYPQLRTIAYVDDLTLHRVGEEEEVKADLADATAQLVKSLEEDCRLVVSREKSGVVVSSEGLAGRLRRGMRRLGFGVSRKTKLLGVDYQPGRGRGCRREVQGKRWKKVVGRRRRVNKMGRRGGPHVVATGVALSARYGATVTGPSCALVRELGTVAAGAYGPMGGRSVWGRLAVRGADHRVGLILAPVRAWLEAVWEGRIEKEEMLAAWKLAQRVTGLSTRPHSTAHGAARSYIAALARLGWRSPSVDAVITREGWAMRVGEVDVTMVMRCAEEDLTIQMGADSAVGKDINDALGERGHYRALAGVPAGSVEVAVGEGGGGGCTWQAPGVDGEAEEQPPVHRSSLPGGGRGGGGVVDGGPPVSCGPAGLGYLQRVWERGRDLLAPYGGMRGDCRREGREGRLP